MRRREFVGGLGSAAVMIAGGASTVLAAKAAPGEAQRALAPLAALVNCQGGDWH